MFSLYSKGCEYAIRALAEMVCANREERFRAEDICLKAGIPEAYARKTFQALVASGFLGAVSGPGGGYSLARDPDKTTVLDVILAVDGKGNFDGCVLGLSSCGDRNPCSLHEVWAKMKSVMTASLAGKTLRSLADDARVRQRRKRAR